MYYLIYLFFRKIINTHIYIYIYTFVCVCVCVCVCVQNIPKNIYIHIYIYIYIYILCFFVFYSISTFVAYVMPNPFLYNNHLYFKQFSLSYVHSLIVKKIFILRHSVYLNSSN